MADKRTGVQVTTAYGGGKNDFFPEGRSIEVTDGVLYIRREKADGGLAGDIIAIYAPQQWHNARVSAEE